MSAWKEIYQIPGFSRYEVRMKSGFEIVDRETGNVVPAHSTSHGRGYPQIRLTDDDGKRCCRSIVTIAGLAFRGQLPDGYRALAMGEELNPSSVIYVTIADFNKYNVRHRRKLSNKQRETLRDMYFSGDYTQDDLADKYGITQATVCRIVNGDVR